MVRLSIEMQEQDGAVGRRSSKRDLKISMQIRRIIIPCDRLTLRLSRIHLI